MKSILVLFFLGILTVGHAQPSAPFDLTTTKGVVYKNVRVRSVEPDGVIYFHTSGVVKILFDELPTEVRKQHGYHPRQAKLYAAADDAQQQALATARAQELAMVQQAAAAELAAAQAAKNPRRGASGADSGHSHSGRFVVSRASTGSYQVRELPRGVGYLQSVGGGH